MIATFLAAGCCAPEYRLDDMRARKLATVHDTVDYFRYAVRLEDWEAVYGTLSPRTQAYIDREIGRFAFKTFVGGLRYRRFDKDAAPEVADLTLPQILHRSSIVGIEPDERVPERIARVQLFYKSPGGKIIPPAKTSFPLVNVRGPKDAYDRWTVGLYEWMREQGAAP